MRAPPAVAFAVCTLIWGTTWLAIKVGYGGLDAVWGASLRFLLASVLVVPLIVARRHPPPMGRRQVGVVLFVGLVLFGFDYGAIYWGEQYIPSGLTAILFATMPLFVAVVNRAVLPGERITPQHVAGILVGLVGLGLIFSDEIGFSPDTAAPMLAIVVAAAAAASSSVVVRRWGRDLEPLVLNAGAMFVGAVALAGASLALGETPALPSTRGAWIALLYLVAFGSILGFLLYWDLLKMWGANRAALVVILTPVVAVVTGLAVGERLNAWQWAGSATVLAGVAVSLYRPTVAAPRVAPVAGGK